ncbi:tetratricopeptide repeat protein [Streptomyces sp. NPDC086554]|uniref:tetratricopeptide repeat protein n=1 Tax=Streptomyces sp. NPDC086554 TaxID=3154864 RepID=UPI0034393308
MRRRTWQLLGMWAVLALCGFLGLGGVLVAGLWLPDAWASAVGGGVTAVTVVIAGRAKQGLDRQAELRQSLPGSTSLRGHVGSALPRVREVDDAIRLGVHPARRDPEDVPSGALPRYIPRAVDEALREALRHERCVVVIGESTAGKTRAAYEAMRTELPGHRLAVPANRESLPALTAYLAQQGAPSVLWLDDMERFLGLGGLTLATVAELSGDGRVGSGTTLLATMRTSEYERFTVRGGAWPNGEGRAAWRAGRELLEASCIVFLHRLWSPDELRAAEAFADDPRIAGALRQAGAFGVAEVLTAGPELLRDWQRAWAPGVHPRAAALVAAAVDCRRAGVDSPVPRELLEELHHHYLRARGGHALRPEPLEEAWEWALDPVHGASSLLIPAGPSDEEPRYLAFDYLIDKTSHDPVPQEIWTLLVSRAAPVQVRRVANEAYWRVRTAFHAAVDSGAVDDVYAQSSALADRGDYAGAIGRLTQVLEDLADREDMEAEGDAADSDGSAPVPESDPAHADPDASESLWSKRKTLRHQIAFFHMRAGHLTEAQEAFRALLSESEARLPADDEYLQVVRHNLASCARRSGDLPGALSQFRRILADRERYLGPTAMNTLDTRRVIARLVCEMGDPAEALRQARDVLQAEEEALGKDHTNVLQTRCVIATFLAASGDHAAAADALAGCLPDLISALGDGHPDVRKAREELADFRSRAVT